MYGRIFVCPLSWNRGNINLISSKYYLFSGKFRFKHGIKLVMENHIQVSSLFARFITLFMPSSFTIWDFVSLPSSLVSPCFPSNLLPNIGAGFTYLLTSAIITYTPCHGWQCQSLGKILASK